MTKVHEFEDLVNLFQELSLMQGCKMILDALSIWATKVIDPSPDIVPQEIITFTLTTFPNHYHPTVLNEWGAGRYWERLIIQFSRRMTAMNIPIPEGGKTTRWKTNRRALDNNELTRRSHIIADNMSRLSIEQALDLVKEIVWGWSLLHDLDELRWHVANYSYRDPKMADQLNEERGIGYIPFLLASMTEH